MPPKPYRKPPRFSRRTKTTAALVGTAALVAVAAALAATVSISSQTATATWLGLTQAAVTTNPLPSQPSVSGNPGSLVPYTLNWTTIPGATAYRIWLDGTPISVVRADPGPTEGRIVVVACGAQHRWNVQGLNGKSVGPLAKPVYFTADACP